MNLVEEIKEIRAQLKALENRHESVNLEIKSLKNRLTLLLERHAGMRVEPQEETKPIPEIASPASQAERTVEQAVPKKIETIYRQDPQRPEPAKNPQRPSVKRTSSDWEKFIGENLISKIGILVIVIGVVFWAKYSIEHNLINPLMRIVLGYVAGIALLGVGMKLKEKYEAYSAVLVSGAMAIMYFITYAGYSLYGLYPQVLAFALMLLFTVFTVVAALMYNRQVIALIGLVGAYAVPFLLSSNSGQAGVLFTYMVIINAGILILSFKKYWKPLYYSSFAFTWLIYIGWFANRYTYTEYFGVAALFLFLFFALFYCAFLAYKLIREEKFQRQDVLLLFANSFVFFAFGYALVDSIPNGDLYLGLFALANALIHFVVTGIIYQKKLADRNLFFLIAGLVLVFITITIPIQLDGNWVTLLWIAEAVLLFWIGRTKQVSLYEKLAYPMILLATLSLFQDWSEGYYLFEGAHTELRSSPLYNIRFLSNALFVIGLGAIVYLGRKHQSTLSDKSGFVKVMEIILPGLFILGLYQLFNFELDTFWNQRYTDSALQTESGYGSYRNSDLLHYRNLWNLNYTLLFLSLLGLFNLSKLKNRVLGVVNVVMTVLAVFAFCSAGLFDLSALRDTYLSDGTDELFNHGAMNIAMRYICFGFLALAVLVIRKYVKSDILKIEVKTYFEIFLHIVLLTIASNELIHWMEMGHSEQSDKLGLSILWGLYSLGLIVYGIKNKRKELRIGAIALFAFTLVKLFFYDIAELNTIAKTIVFVSLGVLLLIISYLYNKNKDITNEK